MTHSPNFNSDSSFPKKNFFSDFDLDQAANWLSKYGKNLAYIFLALVAILCIIYRFSSTNRTSVERDYLEASHDFTVFSKGSSSSAQSSEDAFKNLKGLIDRHPDLHAVYDGVIGQLLLDREQIDEALPFASRTLLRTAVDNFPIYADYAKTSLLIAKGQNQEALNQALALQNKMKQDLDQQPNPFLRSFSDELFAFNLLRIAILYQLMGDTNGELKTWKEWKIYAGLEDSNNRQSTLDSQAFQSVIEQLEMGSVSLPDYIDFREKKLIKN